MMRRLVSPGNPRGSGITLLGVSHLTRLSPSRSASLKSEFGKSMAFALTIPDPMHDLRGGGTVRAGTPAQQRTIRGMRLPFGVRKNRQPR
jgi:hypothetical protein